MQPPRSEAAETSILGSVLIDNSCMNKIVETIKPEYMYKTTNKKICETMFNMYDKSIPIDLITLSDELKKAGILSDVGGVYYLTELGKEIPSSANISEHCKIVKQKFYLRECLKASHKIFQMIETERDYEEILNYMGSVSIKNMESIDRNFKEILHETFNCIDLKKSGQHYGLRSGLKKVDDMTGYHEGGQLIVIGGYSSQGKTTYINHIIYNTTYKQKSPVVLFTLEKDRKEMAGRTLSLHSQVNFFNMYSGNLSPAEWSKIYNATADIEKLPYIIDDTAGVSFSYIKAKSKRLKKTHQIEGVFIDYLQLLDMGNDVKITEGEIAKIITSSKSLAKELNIPVFMVSQFHLHEGTRQNKRPTMMDFKGSGSIHQHADKVILVWLPEKMDLNGDRRRAIIMLAKHSNGPTGEVELRFNPEWIGYEEN